MSDSTFDGLRPQGNAAALLALAERFAVRSY